MIVSRCGSSGPAGRCGSGRCRREVQGYKNQQSWPRLSARLAALHGRGETPKVIAAILDREGFRPPKRASRFTAGMVRRLLHELGLRPRVPRRRRRPRSCRRAKWWLHDLARTLGLSPHTLHGWRKKGWMHARQVGRPWRPVGGVGRRDRVGPPAGVEGMPATVDPSGAAGPIADTRAAWRLISSVRSGGGRAGVDSIPLSHNL